MRSPNGNTKHIISINLGLGQDILDHGINACSDIRCSGRFTRSANTARRRIGVGDVNNSSVSVGAADVDTDAIQARICHGEFVIKTSIGQRVMVKSRSEMHIYTPFDLPASANLKPTLKDFRLY